MARFLIRRVLLGLLVLWLVTIVVFAIFFVNPNGPNAVAHRLAGRQATPQSIALIRHRLHPDAPVIKQYWYFLFGQPHDPTNTGLVPINGSGFHTPNLGHDFYNEVSVNHIIVQAFPITFSLAIGAAVLWLFMGLLSGVLSAVRPRTVMDRSFTFMALFFYSFPTFVLGAVLLLVFFYYFTKNFGITFFPAGTYVPFTQDPVEWARHLLLPWFTLAAVTAAAYTRLTRGSMLDVLGEDYIGTARSKGLGERRVIFRHGLRAALTPIVTQFGIDLGTLLGGAIITETVFGLPGLGFQAIRAVNANDLPIIIGVVVIATAAIVIANLLVDIFYAVLDPRVRLN